MRDLSDVMMTQAARGCGTSYNVWRRAMNWLERDAASVWHPFTQHSLWLGDEPSVIDRADGPWLYDLAGKPVPRGRCSPWGATLRPGSAEIQRAIKAQLDRLAHAPFLGATHVPGIELAERLLATAPGRALPPPDPDRPGGPSPTDPEGPTDPKPTEPTDPTGPDDPPAQVR